MRTPWGPPDHLREIAPGIVEITTPSHGGIRCDPQRNAAIHPALRNDDGFYEEDVEANFVVVCYPQHFDAAAVEAAREAIRSWCPDRYEAFTGEMVTAEDSIVRFDEEFFAAHADDFVVVAAWGSWHEQVPSGKVGVAACRGGDRSKVAAYFLVDAEEYEARDRHFVVDLDRSTELTEPF